MRKALLEFFQKENIIIGATKEGATYNLRFDTDRIWHYNDKLLVEVEKHKRLYKGGRKGKEITYMTREVKVKSDANGNPVYELGRVVMGRGFSVTTRRIWMEQNAEGRLDTGFETLMAHFRADGISKETVDMLRAKWETLGDKEKGRVFNLYRKQTVDANYGSSSLGMRGAGFDMGADFYVDKLNEAIDMVLVE